MLSSAVARRDFSECVRLHLRDVAVIEGSVKEPHRLYVSARNSLQYCLWNAYGNEKLI